MSKRGTESQLTKDDYDRENDDESFSYAMGSFKQASSEVMATRVVKAPRSRKLGTATSGTGAGNPSPFAAMTPLASAPSVQPKFSFATPSSQPPLFGTKPSDSSAPSLFSFAKPATSDEPPRSTFDFATKPAASTSASLFSTPAPAPSLFTASTDKSEPKNPFSTPDKKWDAMSSSGSFFSTSNTFSFQPKSSTASTEPSSTAPSTSSLFAFTPKTSAFTTMSTTISSDNPFSVTSFNKDAPSFTGSSGTSLFSKPPLTTSSSTEAKKDVNENTTSENTFAFKDSVKKTNEKGNSAPDEDARIEKWTEEYEAELEKYNQQYLTKIQTDLKKFPKLDLTQHMENYNKHRNGIKTFYMKKIGGQDKSGNKFSSSLQKSTFGEKSAFGNKDDEAMDTTSTTGSGASAFKGFNFGVTPTEAPISTKSLRENKASEPPKSFGGPMAFSFGAPPSTTSTTTATSGTSAPSLFSSSASATTATSSSSAPSLFSFSGPAKPFSFTGPSPTGPLLFGSTTTAPATTTTPKAFSFQLPDAFKAAAPAAEAEATTTTAASDAPKPFSFQVPTPFQAPGSASAPAGSGADDSAEKVPDDTVSELVETREGEEDETTVFEVRAKLFAYEGNEPKDLGVGQFRINENKDTKKRRMIMRSSGIGKLTLNSWVIQGMGPVRSKTTVTIFAIEDGKPKRFVLRVKEEQSAIELAKELEAGQLDKSK